MCFFRKPKKVASVENGCPAGAVAPPHKQLLGMFERQAHVADVGILGDEVAVDAPSRVELVDLVQFLKK